MIVGAGTMGTNIALNFASHGFEVILADPQSIQLEKARSLATANAALLEKNGLLSEPVPSVLARIRCEPDFKMHAPSADLVVEAVSERLDLKCQVFADLDRVCSQGAILASNTSTFMPSLLSAHLGHPERMLVMHYWNPAHLIPLVEIVPHPKTAPEVVERVTSLLNKCGKRSVLVRKEVPGFIGNRLAFAIQREAMDLVANEVATPAEIDLVASAGFGRRISVTGVFGTADLGGLDVYLSICNSIFPDLSTAKKAPEILSQLVAEGKLGIKSGAGWTDYTQEQILALQTALTEELVRQAAKDR